MKISSPSRQALESPGFSRGEDVNVAAQAERPTATTVQSEVDVDDRGRVSLKRLGVPAGRYRVTTHADGTFTLTPVHSYTAAELAALADPTTHKRCEEVLDGTAAVVDASTIFNLD